jgi:hypothetical protein
VESGVNAADGQAAPASAGVISLRKTASDNAFLNSSRSKRIHGNGRLKPAGNAQAPGVWTSETQQEKRKLVWAQALTSGHQRDSSRSTTTMLGATLSPKTRRARSGGSGHFFGGGACRTDGRMT